jgi:hypothetical protein
MAVRIKELREMALYFQDGFSGGSLVDDAAIIATDTVIGVDTHTIFDDRELVPIGARFTTAGIATIRTVTASQNSTVITLDMSTPSSGTFAITVDGVTDATVAYDVADTVFEAALEALASVGAGNVSVVEATDVYTITFQGDLVNTAVVVTVDGANLTAADSEVFTVTQDGTQTWEITFLPAIATGSVPADDAVITWYPRRFEFEPEGGDFEWNEGANPIVRKPRGVIAGLRQGEEQELTITTSFSFSWMGTETTTLEGATDDKTPYEILYKEGWASDWLPSSHGSPCEPFTIDLVIEDRPQCGSEQAEVFVFPQFAFDEIGPSIASGIVSLSGLCVAKKPIITRTANTDDAAGIVY